ncbi:hypothetical protein PV325_010073 [Microctonus aethiopoides]|nr:hypothetical protein PV325_010073 [Microctonus aethiopoides]
MATGTPIFQCISCSWVLYVVCGLFGGLLIGVGLYAFYDKWQTTGSVRVENVYDVVLNISLVMVIAGGVVFIVSFAGCVGALRENTCLLKFYSWCLLAFFLLEMGVAIVGFVFPHTLQSLLEESFTDKIIQTYREDPDLQNFIDFGQREFKCCGLSQEGYSDWQKNEYFNCSSPGRESCGVPFSCCINTTDISSGLVNIMCGYQIQMLPPSEASKRIWISGCIEIVRSWAERNLYTIAGIALGIALSQLFVIYLAKTQVAGGRTNRQETERSANSRMAFLVLLAISLQQSSNQARELLIGFICLKQSSPWVLAHMQLFARELDNLSLSRARIGTGGTAPKPILTERRIDLVKIVSQICYIQQLDTWYLNSTVNHDDLRIHVDRYERDLSFSDTCAWVIDRACA